MSDRYYLKRQGETDYTEVTCEQFIQAEQSAGFHSKFGRNHPATAGFSVHGKISGKVLSGEADDGHYQAMMEKRCQT